VAFILKEQLEQMTLPNKKKYKVSSVQGHPFKMDYASGFGLHP
jgi:hypothetical protein